MQGNKEVAIIEISTTTGYSPEIIELLYDFTNGDKEGINKILSTLQKNILLFKSNFSSPAIDKYGFFYFAYDIGNKKILEKGFFAYDKFDSLNLDAEWDILRENLLELKSKNDHDSRMTAFFDKELAREGFLREMQRVCHDFYDTPRFEELIETLSSKALSPVFYNKNFSLDAQVELLDPLLFFKPFGEGSKKEIKEEEEDVSLELSPYSEEESAIVSLKVMPVLDPIDGKSVEDLSVADLVLFELSDEREEANYIAGLIEEKNQNGLAGKIKSYKKEDEDNIRISVQFAPGIMGEAVIPATVMLKVLSIEQQIEKESGLDEQKVIKVSYKSFIIGIIVIIFISIFFLLMYS